MRKSIINYIFAVSFCDKYVTLYLMSKQKQLTQAEIKALKANKAAIINSTKIVKK